METFAGILVHTPWWVYLAFAYIIYAGIRATRPRRIPILRLLVPPCIFTLLSIHSLMGRVNDNSLYVMAWSIATTLGFTLGRLEIRRLTFGVDRKNRRLEVPGSFFNLFLFLFFFGAHYYYGFLSATDPERLKGVAFVVVFLMVSGISTGVMWARGLCYLLAYTKTTSAESSGQDTRRRQVELEVFLGNTPGGNDP
jgi:hypothetical protein